MKLSASIPKLKSQAKRKAKEGGIPPAEALNHIAKREGFDSWSLLARKFEEHEAAQRQELPKTITELPLTETRRAWGRGSPCRQSPHAGHAADRHDYALSFEAFIVMEAIDAAVDADAED
jgi:hypothetical protein